MTTFSHLKHLSSLFHFSVLTLPSNLDHVYMPTCTELLPNWSDVLITICRWNSVNIKESAWKKCWSLVTHANSGIFFPIRRRQRQRSVYRLWAEPRAHWQLHYLWQPAPVCRELPDFTARGVGLPGHHGLIMLSTCMQHILRYSSTNT